VTAKELLVCSPFCCVCLDRRLSLSLMLRPTVSRPVLSLNKAPIWDLRPDFYYCQTVAGLLMWGALSDERTGLSFTIATGPRQRSHSRVQVPHFTVSNSRLPFSSPPTIRRATVEVFDPASPPRRPRVRGAETSLHPGSSRGGPTQSRRGCS
jgi:hypothetical protein